MARDKGFHDYVVLDILDGVSGITSKPMFSGWGIFLNGKMFGLISGGEFYIKIDKERVEEFLKKGSRPFTYERKGKQVELGYWLVPEEVLENRNEVERLIFK